MWPQYGKTASSSEPNTQVCIQCVFAIGPAAYLVFRSISGGGVSGCPIGEFAFDEGGGPFGRSDRTNVTLVGHSRDR